MEKKEIIKLINENNSQRDIAKILEISQTNLRYWLNKFGLKTNFEKYNKLAKKITKKYCSKCNSTKEISDFYKRKEKRRYNECAGYCKQCSNKYHSERVKNVKIKMIEYKGCKCERCNLHLKNSHYSVFEFHHINPKEKDINFERIKYQKWEYIKKEIDKCMLACANCHRIIHAEIRGY